MARLGASHFVFRAENSLTFQDREVYNSRHQWASGTAWTAGFFCSEQSLHDVRPVLLSSMGSLAHVCALLTQARLRAVSMTSC